MDIMIIISLNEKKIIDICIIIYVLLQILLFM